MPKVRALVFNLLFYAWSTAVFFAAALTLLLPRGALVKAAEIWAYGTVWLMAVVLGLHVRVEGRENLPKDGKFILASKHQSTIDTILLHLLVKDPAIVLKKELLRIPLYGLYAKRLNMIPVDRAGGLAALKAVIDGAKARLSEGRSVAIYPEGTRRAPHSPPAYKGGVSMMYRQMDVPVVPVALNTGLFWGRGFWDRKGGTLTVRVLPAIPTGLSTQTFQQTLEQTIETATTHLGA